MSDVSETFVLFLFRFVAFSSLRAYSLVAVLLALLVVTVTARDIARSRSTGNTEKTFLNIPGAGQWNNIIYFGHKMQNIKHL